MLVIFCCATVAQVYLEYQINKAFPRIGKWQREHRWFNLVFSLVVSVVLGAMFPATGLIMFTSAIASTMITQPFYSLLRWWGPRKQAWQSSKARQFIRNITH